MKPNETQPELVWVNGRWLLKSVVDRVNAEREEEKRAALAAMRPRPSGTGAKSILSDPPSPGSGVASQIKPSAEMAEQRSGEATRRSGSIKAEAETLRVDATPGNAGRDGGGDSRGSEDGRVLAGEKVYGGSGRSPSAEPTGPAGVPALPGSDQIKPNAEMAEQGSGEATRRSDSIKVEAESVKPNETQPEMVWVGGRRLLKSVFSDQIKPEAASRGKLLHERSL